MKDLIFKFGIGIIFITYCIFVHSVVKNARYGINDRTVSERLFITLLVEMFILALTRLL
jgi:Flp pilus assembly protein protease CpaA